MSKEQDALALEAARDRRGVAGLFVRLVDAPFIALMKRDAWRNTARYRGAEDLLVERHPRAFRALGAQAINEARRLTNNK